VVLAMGLFGACDTTTSSSNGGINAACKADTDCQTSQGLFCSVGDPGGQCLKLCQKLTDCPAGSVCTDENKCYKSCAGSADCTRAGYACVAATRVDKTPIMTCDVPSTSD
jgi:hypothetical protein